MTLPALFYSRGGQAQTHTPTSVSTLGTFTYDASGGRQTDPAGNTYAYDAENRLTSVSGQVSLQNTYDGDGTRLIRVANGTTTHDVGDWYEVDPSTGLDTAYDPFNGQPIAMKTGSTLTYLHHDHLGSLVAASNASGGEVASARYWPFGGLRSSTGTLPTDRLFTGQIRDLNDDRFYFFKARYDDATVGKFHTPDTVRRPHSEGCPRVKGFAACARNNARLVTSPSGFFGRRYDDTPEWTGTGER